MFEVGVVVGGWYTKNKHQNEDADVDDDENSIKRPNDDLSDDDVKPL
ncbi:MAG: hypothetical protein ACI9DQ_000385 [Glaciecola sp.]